MLRNIKNPPKKIYALGNKQLLASRCFAIVGARNCTDYGRKMAIKFSSKLCEHDFCIVSGMAIGIDRFAHIGAMDVLGKTIAVLPSGLENVFPKENLDLFHNILNSGGLVISEYEPKTEANSKTFLERNRIVSGLSIGTLVVEGGRRSGSSVTAKLTKEQNKPVFCIPSSLENSKGFMPNDLIKKGAFLVTSINDILKRYPENLYSKKKIRLKKVQRKRIFKASKFIETQYEKVYRAVPNYAIHINEILKKTKLDINEVSYKLMMLELEKKVVALPRTIF